MATIASTNRKSIVLGSFRSSSPADHDPVSAKEKVEAADTNFTVDLPCPAARAERRLRKNSSSSGKADLSRGNWHNGCL